MIGVLHAYSRDNAGDGLLVDLTLERLARHGVTGDDVLLLALDPASFDDLPHRRASGTPGRALDGRALLAAGRGTGLVASALARRPLTRLARELRVCTALVAVGGGYLRTPGHTSALGTGLNHLPQLWLAANSDRPTLYLPQSVGPLRGPVGAGVRRLLGRVEHVLVRDDHSLQELSGLDNVHRSPDLAVLHLAEHPPQVQGGSGGATALVGRALDHLPDASERLTGLAAQLPGPVLYAVQATGDPTKSDESFYARSGVRTAGRLADLMSEGAVDVVVSVRLHGALMAMMAGVPTVHLAYDRKGPAAFADLGLSRWCLDVRSSNPQRVASLVRALRHDPSDFWRALEARRRDLVALSHSLDATVGEVVRG